MKYLNLILGLLCCSLSLNAKTARDTPTVSCSPNPFVEDITVSFNSKTTQKASIQFMDLLGRSVLVDSIQLITGMNSRRYSLKGQSSGMYVLMVNGQNWSRTQKVVYSSKTPSPSDSFDVVHYDIALSIQNLASKTISGTTILTIDPTQTDSLSTIKIDLLKLAVTDVKVNNTVTTFSQNDSELYVVVNRKNSPTNDSLINVAITYNGQPETDPQWGGFYFSGNYAYNMGVAFKNVPHNFGRCWFPCIDNFTGRATYTFHITTDPTFKAVCNGLQLPETINGDGSTTWNWELKQPIPTYLASVAVGKYEFIKYEFQGMNRTYPVWLAVVAADTAKAKQSFAKLNNALLCFESKYGPYPFDRVGYVGVPFNAGAMEHATNIAYPNYAIDGGTNYETLFAHEISHMWWGDLATCRTAEDMWLNEGWASFNEALFLECVYGKEAYLSDIKDKSNEVLLRAPKNDGGWYPVSGIPQNITYGTHVYKKGALMVHTLRSLMGDSSFFAACKSYLNKYTFADVSSEDLKNEFQKCTSINLSNFFQKWIYSPGHSDVVVSKYTFSKVNSENHYRFEFSELQRKNTHVSESLPFTLTLYVLYSTPRIYFLQLVNGTSSWEGAFPQNESIVGWSVNHDNKIYLGNRTETLLISQTGNVAVPNVLFSLNVQSTGTGTGGNNLAVTHHWVGPLNEKLNEKGIRISAERYWTINSYVNEGFKTWGFFNYDGTPSTYLDSELINKTEDSLVLLYRAFPGEEWQIHTENTFQPGNSKTDKVGRFWVNDVKSGEYTFGMRDASVVSISEVLPADQKESFMLIPNPADDKLLVQFPGKVQVKNIYIYSQQGKLLKTLSINTVITSTPINIDFLEPNAYVIMVELRDTSLSQLFIKK
jgi:aminopeptidase N